MEPVIDIDAEEDARVTLLERIFRQSPSFLLVLRGPDFIFEMANAAYHELVGERDLIGRPAFEVFPDGVRDGFLEKLQQVVATGRPFSGRELPVTMRRTRHGDPEERLLDLTYLPLADDDGVVRRVLGHGTDVTDHVRARGRAEAERARLVLAMDADRRRLRSLIEIMPIPVALHTGPEHRFEIVSEGFRSVSAGRDLTGLTPREAYPDIIGHGILERFDDVVRTGVPWISTETHARFDRRGHGVEDTWFNIRYEPVRDADGEVIGVLNVSVDITEEVRARRELEAVNARLSEQQRDLESTNRDLYRAAKELAVRTLDAEAARGDIERLLSDSESARSEAEAARRDAEAANRGKAEFLAAMSHELRTPLNAIGGYAELMEIGVRGPVSSAQLEDLRRIRVSQRHLLRLVNEILNYARIETGTVHYDVEDVPLATLVTSVEPLIAPQLAAKNLRFHYDHCGDTPLIARADHEKTRQVLLNLLSNAIKFTDAGGTVDVGCAALDGTVLVHVRDSGIGIPCAEQQRVFEPFVQVDASLTRAHEGAGLGLAISRDLARGMGGDLTVESRPGEGSTFTLVLPRGADRVPVHSIRV